MFTVKSGLFDRNSLVPSKGSTAQSTSESRKLESGDDSSDKIGISELYSIRDLKIKSLAILSVAVTGDP